MRKIILIVIVLLLGITLGFADKKYPRTGVGLRGGAFGIPDQILDYFIYEHPQIKGESFAFEIRSYGDRGTRSVFSGVYSLEYSRMHGEGPWRDEKDHRRLDGKGEITQMSFTATILMSLFPNSPVHPYIGGGLGVGKLSIWYEGSYQDELGTTVTDRYEEDRIVPVVHIPVGIIINLKDRFEFRIEGGFKNGFYIGGAAVINF